MGKVVRPLTSIFSITFTGLSTVREPVQTVLLPVEAELVPERLA